MAFHKRLITLIILLLIILAGLALYSLRSISDQFQSFSITINNQSNYDIISVEAGLIDGSSIDHYKEKIKDGKTVRFKPKLKLAGEGAIYLRVTDSRGETTEETVCGTESLSGYSKVTLYNDKVSIEQKCM